MIKRLFRISAYLVALFVFFFILKSFTPNQDFSILIKDGHIIDGTGNPWFKGDLGINGKKIDAIGNLSKKRARITIEEAIRKMSSLPAQTFRIQQRGMLREGMYADITVFNDNTFKDNASFTSPHQYSQGLKYVIVNGDIVAKNDTHTGKRPGMVIYGQGKKQEGENESQD